MRWVLLVALATCYCLTDSDLTPRVQVPVVLYNADGTARVNLTVAYAFMQDRWLRHGGEAGVGVEHAVTRH